VLLASGGLAGSCLTMERGVRNLVSVGLMLVKAVLPFGLADSASRLPIRGPAMDALQEIAGGVALRDGPSAKLKPRGADLSPSGFHPRRRRKSMKPDRCEPDSTALRCAGC
jgi:hypothetical protein